MAGDDAQDETLTLAEQCSLERKENSNEYPDEAASEEVVNEENIEAPKGDNSNSKPVVEESNGAPNEEDSKVEEDGEEKPVIKLETAPADIRFPTTNQTRHCYTRYIEYHQCKAAKGEGAPECEKFAKYYRSLCPSEWIERWNEQRANGTFPGPL